VLGRPNARPALLLCFVASALSVDPAADDGRMSDDNRATTCTNAASPNYSTRADYCVRFSSTQGDDAS
jgi:hypothetical protein